MRAFGQTPGTAEEHFAAQQIPSRISNLGDLVRRASRVSGEDTVKNEAVRGERAFVPKVPPTASMLC